MTCDLDGNILSINCSIDIAIFFEILLRLLTILLQMMESKNIIYVLLYSV